ncbi:MAG TPA: hypothetical protein VLE49_02635 [Anaerolineales bacterium]|nr:hypothetical protein [Anaerolineales bacterium]
MKLWKTLIRIWLTLASLISFLVGWVVLAHAPKPNQFKASNVQAAPKLDPVPSLDQVMNSDQSQAQSFLSVQPIQRRPVLRSGGS